MDQACYRIEHETRHSHAGRASTSRHVACLKPRALPRQRVLKCLLRVDPAPADLAARTDYFGNTLEYFTILTPYNDLRVLSRSVVEVLPPDATIEPDASLAWEAVRDALVYQRGAAYEEAAQFSYPSPYAPVDVVLGAFARESFVPGRPLVAAAVDLMLRIHRDFVFDARATSVSTPVTRVLAERHGVCQDFAHLHIAAMRSLGRRRAMSAGTC